MAECFYFIASSTSYTSPTLVRRGALRQRNNTFVNWFKRLRLPDEYHSRRLWEHYIADS